MGEVGVGRFHSLVGGDGRGGEWESGVGVLCRRRRGETIFQLVLTSPRLGSSWLASARPPLWPDRVHA